jgi:hypothetical protein
VTLSLVAPPPSTGPEPDTDQENTR